MQKDEFRFAWPEHLDLEVTINWSKPELHDVLFSGGIDDDDTAYFYAIVSKKKGEWWSFYIGMTYAQSSSVRNGQADHHQRLERLRRVCPGSTFRITLGTPTFTKGAARVSSKVIGTLEALLIYSNWHEGMINNRKTVSFAQSKQIYIKNTGWTKHLSTEIGYGVFYRLSD
jgi:hypothetical protein